ncbi:MAG: hypothetical protein IIC78_01215 [Chloroflexi bacterium]|nr:hypothetical protein [Chloroflexota bacterium]
MKLDSLDKSKENGNSPNTWGKVLAHGFDLALRGLLGWGWIRVQAGPRDRGLAPDFSVLIFNGESVALIE